MSVVFEKPTCQFWSNGCQFSVTPLGSMRVDRQSRRNQVGGGGLPDFVKLGPTPFDQVLSCFLMNHVIIVKLRWTVVSSPPLIFRRSYGPDRASCTYWTREPSLACGLWKNTLFFLSVSLWLDFSNFVVKRKDFFGYPYPLSPTP